MNVIQRAKMTMVLMVIAIFTSGCWASTAINAVGTTPVVSTINEMAPGVLPVSEDSFVITYGSKF